MRKIITYILVIILGSGFCIWGGGLIAEARSTLLWPIVNGTVTHSEVTSYLSPSEGKSTQMYSTDVRYTLNGTQYNSSSISLGDSFSSDSGGKAEIVRLYAVGQQILVYYDLLRPGSALFELGPVLITYIPFTFGLLCILDGLIAFFRKRGDLFEADPFQKRTR